MTRKDSLALDEFVTAPRKRLPMAAPDAIGDSKPTDPRAGTDAEERGSSSAQKEGKSADDDRRRQDARKALRRVKRERTKGVSYFVNVNLDRNTKRRLKLAAFNAETSMQMIMERAIRSYLDDHNL